MKEVAMKHLRIKAIMMLVLILVSLSAVLVLTAGKDKEEAMEGPMEITEPTKKVTLNWWFQDWAGGVGWMNEYVVVFEKNHPNIDLNFIPVPFNDLYAKMIPSIAQGNEPEIMYGYDEWLVGKDASKLFYPLTPTIMSVSEFKDHIYEATLKNVTGSDGNVYGLPFLTGANAFGFVYHKDLFRQAGIDATKIKSWDDLKAAAKKLTKYNADGSIQRSGILFSYTEAANAFLDMIQMQGAGNKMFSLSALEWNFKIPEAKKAMQTFQWFVDNNIYDPKAGDPFTTFPNKLGAMLLIGPWDVGLAMTQFPELEVGYILMPPFPTANTDLVLGSVVSYGSLMISKRVEGDTRNAALIFIRDIMTKPIELYDISFYKKPPFWVGAVCNKKYIKELMSRSGSEMNEFSQTCLTATNKGLPAIKTLETKISEPILIRQVIHPEMENVFLGNKTIDEMLDYITSYLTSQEKQLAE
jgi:ABC-type glycerol-3-phosphate transport system substrate-binding protein